MGNTLTIKGGGISQAQVLALIAANAAPLNHKTQHQTGGADEITVQGLAGILTAEQLSSWAGVSGKPTEFAPGAGEGQIFIDLLFQDTTASGTWSWSIDPGSYSHGHLLNTSHASGDYATFQVFLAAGTYTLKLLHPVNTNYGIAKFLINSVEVAAFDQYAAVPAYNLIKTQQGIVIATSGLKTLKLLVDSKNASSSNYYILFGRIVLFRTA